MTVRQMTVPQFFVTPGFGEALGNEFYYSQALRLGDRVEISGQGGWTDELSFPEPIEEEIALAFDNVERTLNCAGASWTDVVSVVSYHVPLDDSPAIESEVFAVINEEFKRRMPERAPIWTAVAVPKLGIDGMRIEIAVTAIAAGD
jgi:enamine deaminase RidA (YjgF/YER057c/UK114 family)